MSYLIDKGMERLTLHGPAWAGSRTGSMREMNEGLAIHIDKNRADGKNIIRDYYPQETEQIDEWDGVLALPAVATLSDADRRKRIEATRSGLPVNLFSGQTEFINLSGFNVRLRPLEEAEDPNLLTDVNVIGDGSFSGLNRVFTIPVDPLEWTLLYVVESLDGSSIVLSQDEYNTLRFLILKSKPPFMWCLLRAFVL